MSTDDFRFELGEGLRKGESDRWVYEIEDKLESDELYRLSGFRHESVKGWKKISRMIILNSALRSAVNEAKKCVGLYDARVEPQGLRIVGESGTGKSTAVRLLLAELQDPTVIDFQNDKIAHQIRLMSKSTRLSVVRDGLHRFGHPLGLKNLNTRTFDVKLELFVRALEQAKTRVLLIDEAQNIFACNRGKIHKSTFENEITDLICFLIDRLKIPVVLVGYPELLRLDNFDAGLSSRVRKTVLMPPLNSSLWQESLEAYFQALSEFADPRPLTESKCFQKIKGHVEGQQRQLKRLMAEIALHSIERKARKIDSDILDLALNSLRKRSLEDIRSVF